MSFSSSIREELWTLPIKNACCRKSFLYGLLLRADPRNDGGISALIPVCSGCGETEKEIVNAHIRVCFGKQSTVTPETHGAHRYIRVNLASRQAAAFLQTVSQVSTVNDNGTADPGTAENIMSFHCSACAALFLRGAYLSSGTAGNPEREAQMEYRLPSDGRAVCVASLWTAAGQTPGVVRQADTTRLFFKGLSSLQDALSYLGAVQAVFQLCNIQLVRDVMRNESRATNCETANISRTVRAGERQIAAIRELEESCLLPGLPLELQETAALRVQHPEVSLSELAALHHPPITKSGLNHRLERIMAFRKKALSEK